MFAEVVKMIYLQVNKNEPLSVKDMCKVTNVSRVTFNKIRNGDHPLWKEAEKAGVMYIPSKMASCSVGGIRFLKTMRVMQLNRMKEHNLLGVDMYLKKLKKVYLDYYKAQKKNSVRYKKVLIRDFIKMDKTYKSHESCSVAEIALKNSDKKIWRSRRKYYKTFENELAEKILNIEVEAKERAKICTNKEKRRVQEIKNGLKELNVKYSAGKYSGANYGF